MKFLERHARRTGSLAASYLLGGKWLLALLGRNDSAGSRCKYS